MDKKNLLKRVISAIVLIPIVLYCILEGGYFYLGLITLISVLSTYELMNIQYAKNIEKHVFSSYLSALLLPYFFFTGNIEFAMLALVFLFVFVQIRELSSPSESPIYSVAGNVNTIGYIHLFLATSVYVREHYSDIFGAGNEQGGYFILMIFLGIWACDTFAYFGGSTYGKRKLYEKISPKKSIEGALTGFIGTVAVVFIFSNTFLNELTLGLKIILICVIGVGGQIGDLIESMFKRDAKIKDSGNTIPGHGGVLDRIDSFIFVSPIIFITIKLYEHFV